MNREEQMLNMIKSFLHDPEKIHSCKNMCKRMKMLNQNEILGFVLNSLNEI